MMKVMLFIAGTGLLSMMPSCAIWVVAQDSQSVRNELKTFVSSKFLKLRFLKGPVVYEIFTQTMVGGVEDIEGATLFKEEFLGKSHSVVQAYRPDPVPELLTNPRPFFAEGIFSNPVSYDEVGIFNNSYSAELFRNPNGLVIRKTTDRSTNTSTTSTDVVSPIWLRDFYTVANNLPVVELAVMDEIELVAFDAAIVNGIDSMQLVFRVPVQFAGNGYLQENTVVFAQDDGRMLKWEYVDSQDSSRMIRGATYEYDLQDGSSIPKAVRIVDYVQDFEILSLIRNMEFIKNPEFDRCFLSFYGLPEPDWYRPPPPYWLYVSISGMVLLVIGALLIRYGKSLWRRG